MDGENTFLKRQERAVFQLRRLYESFGYKKYKMSKFEEYDFYLEHKSFLPSTQIISFTDLRGRLLALKPDVTLSIAKNAPACPSAPEKVYYNESVYRVPKGSREYREITQVGLEYMGMLDLYGQCEVLLLAYKSLQCLGEGCMLLLSHMGFISGLLEFCALPPATEEKILGLINQKNAHEIQRLCLENGVDSEKQSCLTALTQLCGGAEETLDKAEKLAQNDRMSESVIQMREIWQVLAPYVDGERVRLDFSVINDLSYYNGLIFQGFAAESPSAILSGGRYDGLMERLGKKTQAMGFAVYTDFLERCGKGEQSYDTDVLLLYQPGAQVSELFAAVQSLEARGLRVRVQNVPSEKLSFGQILKFSERGLEPLEAND